MTSPDSSTSPATDTVPIDPSSPSPYADVVAQAGGYVVPVDPMDAIDTDCCQ